MGILWWGSESQILLLAIDEQEARMPREYTDVRNGLG